jgi:hypothetical protein
MRAGGEAARGVPLISGGRDLKRAGRIDRLPRGFDPRPCPANRGRSAPAARIVGLFSPRSTLDSIARLTERAGQVVVTG